MKILCSANAHQFLRKKMTAEVEEFWIVSLKSNKEVVAAECLFRGTVDACLIHMRDVFRHLCLNNASSFIIAHNHPSQDTSPSKSDLMLTRQVLQASRLMQIPLIDHLIITDRHFTSLADAGWIYDETQREPLPAGC